MAGLAGASLSLGSLNVFTNGMSADKGFLAYAANRFGQWTPGGSYLAALLFGGMDALRLRLQELNIAPQLLRMLPYLTTLLALMFTGKSCVLRLRTVCRLCIRYPRNAQKKQQDHASKSAAHENLSNKRKEDFGYGLFQK